MRVQDLAKELGVDPAAIIAKCKAEGIDLLRDHLSPVGKGLAMTIREWFKGGGPNDQ